MHVAARRVGPEAVTGPVAGGAFEQYLELSVRDSGIGISAADQARLFKPFTQIDSTLARRHQGTGLGLAMVKRLAELHGGAVALHSEADQGSTFTVWLPWRSAAISRPARRSPRYRPCPQYRPTARIFWR